MRHPDLKPLYARAKQMIERFASFRIGHVRREQNRDADRLVNAALDRAAADGSGESIEFIDRPTGSSS